MSANNIRVARGNAIHSPPALSPPTKPPRPTAGKDEFFLLIVRSQRTENFIKTHSLCAKNKRFGDATR
jgi:hypothetical protein